MFENCDWGCSRLLGCRKAEVAMQQVAPYPHFVLEKLDLEAQGWRRILASGIPK